VTRELDPRLSTLRGPAPALPHNARTLAALTANPGCTRRAVLDAAGADKDLIAQRIGFDPNRRLSRLALARGQRFETQVKAEGYAHVIRILRELLGLEASEVGLVSLDEVGGNPAPGMRYSRTRAQLTSVARGSQNGTLFDHPTLRLTVAGNPVYLEPDLIAFQIAGRFHVLEVKSFAIIDGQADSAQVKPATTQAAAYILALREMLAQQGPVEDLVSDHAIIIAPRDFTNTPVGAVVDARKEIRTLKRQLDRLTRVGDLLDLLPRGLTVDLQLDQDGNPQRAPSELIDALEEIPAKYRPRCLGSCELARYCREQARSEASLDALGPSVRDHLGGIETLTMALDLAHGRREPEPEQVPVATALRHAMTIRAQLKGAA
jgi:hypothetical protein